jgi:hypothetical protein
MEGNRINGLAHTGKKTSKANYCTRCITIVAGGIARHARLKHVICPYASCQWNGLGKDFKEHNCTAHGQGNGTVQVEQHLSQDSADEALPQSHHDWSADTVRSIHDVFHKLGIPDTASHWPLQVMNNLPNGRAAPEETLRHFGEDGKDRPRVVNTRQVTAPEGIVAIERLLAGLFTEETVDVSRVDYL